MGTSLDKINDMRNLIFLLLATLSLQTQTLSAESNTKPGNNYYIWAKNGLNLRESPSTSAQKIGKLNYGDEVTVLSLTEKKYNEKVVTKISPDQTRFKTEPYIIKGQWVEILTKGGLTAYVIDLYFSSKKPHDPSIKFYRGTNLTPIQIDTVFKRDEFRDGEVLNVRVKKQYEGGISAMEESGGVWASTAISFPNTTIQEAFIIYFSHLESEDQCQVYLNWPDELILYDLGICSFYFKTKNGTTTLEVTCSC